MSLSEGIFPTKFKLAIVKPLFKNGNKESMRNYRPISMICNFSKLLEKIVKYRLMSFLEKHHLLSKNQFGFRPGVGTVDAIYSVSRHIYKGLDRGDKTVGIFLDFAKAFDTVDHKILLKILPNFGIKNNSLSWFASYLKDRMQMVMVNDVLGKELVFNCDVPQGSVLGPILFIIYINSICDSQTDGSIFTYADDTCLLYSDTSWDSVYAKASTGLKQIIRKLNIKKITLNLDKTEFIAFSIYSCQSPFEEIEITDNIHNRNGCKIKRVTRVRYLGLIFDQNRKWQLHINSMTMCLRTIMYKIYCLRKIISPMRIVYLSLYQAIFQYGIIAWGGSYENAIKPLTIQQNKIVRKCLDKNTLEGSNKLNYKCLGVLPINLLYKKFAIMFFIKNTPITDIVFSKRYRTHDISNNYTKKNIGQRFVDYLGPTFFNAMPLAIKKTIRSNPKSNHKLIIYNYSERVT